MFRSSLRKPGALGALISMVVLLCFTPTPAAMGGEPLREHEGFVPLEVPADFYEEVWTDMRPLSLKEAKLTTKREPIEIEGAESGEVLMEFDPEGKLVYVGVSENLKRVARLIIIEPDDAQTELGGMDTCVFSLMIPIIGVDQWLACIKAKQG